MAVLGGARPATAAPCPVDPSVEPAHDVAAIDAGPRLGFIRRELAVGARRARIWSAVWGAAYGAAAITTLAVSPAVSSETRVDLYVAATSASIGALTRSIMVPRVIREHRRLERHLAQRREDCAAVRAAEQALARSARSDRRGRSVLVHLAAVAYNLAVGVVLGVAFDRPVSGARQAAVGATVGQIMIITQPIRSLRALTDYRNGTLRPTTSMAPLVLPGGGGLVVGGRF